MTVTDSETPSVPLQSEGAATDPTQRDAKARKRPESREKTLLQEIKATQVDHAFARELLKQARSLASSLPEEAEQIKQMAVRYDTFLRSHGLDNLPSRNSVRQHAFKSFDALVATNARIRDHVRWWLHPHSGALAVTTEPYLQMQHYSAVIEPETRALRAAGWTITVEKSPYAPGSALMILAVSPADWIHQVPPRYRSG